MATRSRGLAAVRTRRGAVRVKEAESEACILVFVCGVDEGGACLWGDSTFRPRRKSNKPTRIEYHHHFQPKEPKAAILRDPRANCAARLSSDSAFSLNKWQS